MKRLPLIAALAMGTSLVTAAPAAMAQQTSPVPTIQTGHTLLTVSAEGSSARTPDMARYSAGVTTQGATASEALSANSAQMNRVMAALKQAGIADKDIQTSNLNLRPVYAQPKRQPDGSYDTSEQRIVAYRATNTVSVRQRKLEDMGKVIDALVKAGANQVNGPNFALSEPDEAQDEARMEAMKKARERANLYAKAAGLRVVGIVSISESGGYTPSPVMYARAEKMDAAAPPPVAAGELEMNVNVTVQFELAP